MADITPINTNMSLLERLKDFMNDPKFHPKNQDKYFFSTGMSYYQQLCSVLKMLEGFSEAFAIVWENEKSLAEGIVTREILDAEIAQLKNELEAEIRAIEEGTETRFEGIEDAIENFRSTINSINQQLAQKLRSVSIEGTGISVYDEGIFDGVQRIRLTAQSGPGLTLSQNLSYANSANSPIVVEASAITNDYGTVLNDAIEFESIYNGSETAHSVATASFSSQDFKRGSASEIMLKEKPITKTGTEGNIIFQVTTDSTGARVLNGSVDGSAFASASALATTNAKLSTVESTANSANVTSSANSARIADVEEFISTELPAQYAEKDSLALVATSGSYNDLAGKPALKTVATSGSYNDLSDKPTIPTVPSNIVTGSGTNGYLVKFTGARTVGNAIQLGTSTDTFLRNDGTWAKAGSFAPIDTSKCITPGDIASGTAYTAPYDGWFTAQGGTGTVVSINGVAVISSGGSTSIGIFTVPLGSGQVLTATKNLTQVHFNGV